MRLCSGSNRNCEPGKTSMSSNFNMVICMQAGLQGAQPLRRHAPASAPQHPQRSRHCRGLHRHLPAAVRGRGGAAHLAPGHFCAHLRGRALLREGGLHRPLLRRRWATAAARPRCCVGGRSLDIAVHVDLASSQAMMHVARYASCMSSLNASWRQDLLSHMCAAYGRC